MPLTLDVTADFAEVIDGLEVAALVHRDLSSESITHALRSPMSVREAAASNGRYTTSDIVWHFPAGEVATPPELGSSILSAEAATWRVLETRLDTFSQTYRCICRNLAISAGLDTLVTIQVATYAKGASGSQEPTWANQSTNVLAKIQLESSERTVEHGRQHMPRKAMVYFATQVLLSTNHRIVGPDNVVYRVVSWKDADKIDTLFSVECEVTKWPLS